MGKQNRNPISVLEEVFGVAKSDSDQIFAEVNKQYHELMNNMNSMVQEFI